MSSSPTVTLLASLPAPSLIENLAIRQDNSILLTVYSDKTLYHLPNLSTPTNPSTPIPIHKFPHPILGITELSPDEFFIACSDANIPGSSALWRLDLSSLYKQIQPERAVTFPDAAVQLNGLCVLAKRILLVADSGAGIIWRVNLPAPNTNPPTLPVAHYWFSAPELQPLRDGIRDSWGGVNGIHFSPRRRKVFFTSTGQEKFCAVGVNTVTLEAQDSFQVLREGVLGDDFCLWEGRHANFQGIRIGVNGHPQPDHDDPTDQEYEHHRDFGHGCAYITTHPQNTLERISLDGRRRETILGNPRDDRFLGPTSCAWARGPGEEGRVLVCTATGGIIAPVEGGVRDGSVLRVDFGRGEAWGSED